MSTQAKYVADGIISYAAGGITANSAKFVTKDFIITKLVQQSQLKKHNHRWCMQGERSEECSVVTAFLWYIIPTGETHICGLEKIYLQTTWKQQERQQVL